MIAIILKALLGVICCVVGIELLAYGLLLVLRAIKMAAGIQ